MISGNGAAYTYDSQNHVATVTRAGVTIQYSYDVDGNRLSASGAPGTLYLVDPEASYAQVVEERDGTGVLLARYDAPDDLLQMERSNGTYYYLADGLNSTRQLVDGSGTVTDTYAYDAFRALLLGSSSTPTLNPFGFDGQQWDRAAGSYYLRARYYNPGTGRFLSQDPYEGDEEDPVTPHRYLYAGADPVNREDPGGEIDVTMDSVMTAETMDTSLGRTLGSIEAFIAQRAATEAVTYYALHAIAGTISAAALLSGDSPLTGARQRPARWIPLLRAWNDVEQMGSIRNWSRRRR